MPVLVRHPRHTDDCIVCQHAAIPGMGELLPKTPEEHAATCCSPERVAAREEFEQRAMDALVSPEQARRERREEIAFRERMVEEQARQERAVRPVLNPLPPRAPHHSWLESKVERLRFRGRRVRRQAELLKGKVVPHKPIPGYEQTTWFENADPVVADLFASAQSPSRLDRLRARLRRA